MESVETGFDHLDPAGRLTAQVAVRPRGAVYLALAAAVLGSWLLLLMMAARASRAPGASIPGAELLSGLPMLSLPAWAERLLDMCLTPVTAGAAPGVFPAFVLMWFLMAVATMLPSAAPMVRTYCEIADTAARQGKPSVHPLVLVAGYLATWLAASGVFAAMAAAVQAFGGVSAAGTLPTMAAAGALALAGLYQFSSLKEACLEKCRNPFAVLFSRWSTDPARIFRLGVDQGLWCLGCCWALMLVMFAVGIMNVFWMALLGALAIVEKQLSGPMLTRFSGAILLVWGAALLVLSVWTGKG